VCFTFTPFNDEIIEGDESFTFNPAAENGFDEFVQNMSEPFTLVIFDDDGEKLLLLWK
jgi:hypothetical protein